MDCGRFGFSLKLCHNSQMSSQLKNPLNSKYSHDPIHLAQFGPPSNYLILDDYFELSEQNLIRKLNILKKTTSQYHHHIQASSEVIQEINQITVLLPELESNSISSEDDDPQLFFSATQNNDLASVTKNQKLLHEQENNISGRIVFHPDGTIGKELEVISTNSPRNIQHFPDDHRSERIRYPKETIHLMNNNNITNSEILLQLPPPSIPSPPSNTINKKWQGHDIVLQQREEQQDDKQPVLVMKNSSLKSGSNIPNELSTMLLNSISPLESRNREKEKDVSIRKEIRAWDANLKADDTNRSKIYQDQSLKKPNGLPLAVTAMNENDSGTQSSNFFDFHSSAFSTMRENDPFDEVASDLQRIPSFSSSYQGNSDDDLDDFEESAMIQYQIKLEQDRRKEPLHQKKTDHMKHDLNPREELNQRKLNKREAAATTTKSDERKQEDLYVKLADFEDLINYSSANKFSVKGELLFNRMLREHSRIQLKRLMLEDSVDLYVNMHCGDLDDGLAESRTYAIGESERDSSYASSNCKNGLGSRTTTSRSSLIDKDQSVLFVI